MTPPFSDIYIPYLLLRHHWWRVRPSVSERIQTDIYRHRVIDHISPLPALILPGDHIHGNPFAIVVHKKMSKYLLSDEFFFAGVEVDQSRGIKELTSGNRICGSTSPPV